MAIRLANVNDKNINQNLQLLANEINDLKNKLVKLDGQLSHQSDIGSFSFVKRANNKYYLEYKSKDKVYTTVSDIFTEKSNTIPIPHFEYLEIDNLSVKSFALRQINALNGEQIWSDTAKIKDVRGKVLVLDIEGDIAPFVIGDLVITKIYKPDKSDIIRYVKAKVTAVQGKTITVDYYSAKVFEKGDVIVRIGNETEANRQGFLYASTSITRPYLDIVNGIASFDAYDSYLPKIRLGYLEDITDNDFGGQLQGWGLYAGGNANVYIKGKILLTNPEEVAEQIKSEIPANITIYAGTTPDKRPDGSDLQIGDLWINYNDNNQLRRWNGSAWIVVDSLYADFNLLYNIPSTLQAPSSSGLYLSSTAMGFYNAGQWKTYISNSGDFIFGDINNSHGLAWNQNAGTLTIKGVVSIVNGSLGFSNFSDNSLDNVNDGSTYKRVLATSIQNGKILLSETIGNIDDIADGTNYGKVLKTSIQAGRILLSETVGNLDDIDDGNNYAKILKTEIEAGHIKILGSDGQTTVISGGKIQTGSIKAQDISVENLSALSANLGVVTSGSLIGATIKTGNSNPKVELTQGGIHGYNALGELTFSIPTSTGTPYFKGTVDNSNINASNIAGGTIIGSLFKTSNSYPRIEINSGGLYCYNNTGEEIAYFSPPNVYIKNGTIESSIIQAGLIIGSTFKTSAEIFPRIEIQGNTFTSKGYFGNLVIEGSTLTITGSGNIQISGNNVAVENWVYNNFTPRFSSGSGYYYRNSDGSLTLASGTASWGTISGTLSNQTDLWNELSDKVSLTGSYSNPSWITSLAGSKITGTVTSATNAINSTYAIEADWADEAGSVSWSNIYNKPSTFPPSAHTHGNSDITDLAWSKLTGVPTASSTTSGILTSTDWNTFNNKANASHTHTVSNITDINTYYYSKTNLQTSGEASVHFNNITNKPTTLSGYGITDGVPTSRTISTNAPLTGGGALSSNLSLGFSYSPHFTVSGGALTLSYVPQSLISGAWGSGGTYTQPLTLGGTSYTLLKSGAYTGTITFEDYYGYTVTINVNNGLITSWTKN